MKDRNTMEDGEETTDIGRNWRASLDPKEGEEGVSPYANSSIELENVWDIYHQPNPDDITIFDDFRDAAKWRETQSAIENPPSDPSLPSTAVQIRSCVKLLFKAFKSTNSAVDNRAMIDPFLKEKHDNRRAEALCWDVLHAVIKYAETGPLLAAYAPDKVSKTSNLRTFAERFNAVVGVLASYKTICKHLFDAPYINTFVDDPIHCANRVESNKRLNAAKGKCMAAGKKILENDPDSQDSAKKRRRVLRSRAADESSDGQPGSSYTFGNSPSSPAPVGLGTPASADGQTARVARSASRNVSTDHPQPAHQLPNLPRHYSAIKHESSPKQAPIFTGSPSAYRTTENLSRDVEHLPSLRTNVQLKENHGHRKFNPYQSQVAVNSFAPYDQYNIQTQPMSFMRGPTDTSMYARGFGGPAMIPTGMNQMQAFHSINGINENNGQTHVSHGSGSGFPVSIIIAMYVLSSLTYNQETRYAPQLGWVGNTTSAPGDHTNYMNAVPVSHCDP